MTEMTSAEFLTELKARFGPNPRDWAFVCPACGDIATGGDFTKALKEHPRERNGLPMVASDILGQECLGRSLGALKGPSGKWKGRGCDWCAYGLIGGPLAVTMPDGNVIRSFEIAPARGVSA